MIDAWNGIIGNGSAMNQTQVNIQTGNVYVDGLIFVAITVALVLLVFFTWRR